MNTDPIASEAVEAVRRRRPSRTASAFRRRRMIDRMAERTIFAVALIAIATIFLIFIYVAREAWPLVSQSIDGLSLATPFRSPVAWQPVSAVPKYNVLPLLLGTFKVTLIALSVATPLALGAALYT